MDEAAERRAGGAADAGGAGRRDAPAGRRARAGRALVLRAGRAHRARSRGARGPSRCSPSSMGVMLDGRSVPVARALAREWAGGYLELPNYANNWRRLGFDEDDVAGGGLGPAAGRGVRLGAEAIADRVRAHLDAGADHVCIQVIGLGRAGRRTAALRGARAGVAQRADPSRRSRDRGSSRSASRAIHRASAILERSSSASASSIAAGCSARFRFPIWRSAQLTAFLTSLRSSVAAARISGNRRGRRRRARSLRARRGGRSSRRRSAS